MLRLEQTTAPQLCALLEHDRVPFAVMRNILAGAFGPVGKILSDEKRMIVCYTCPPFPGWAWLPKDATEAEMAHCWQVIREELPPESGYCINMTPALAAYVMGTQEGKAYLHILTPCNHTLSKKQLDVTCCIGVHSSIMGS